MSEVIARFNENKILFIKNEIIEEIDMPLPTFTRNSVAYLSDGTQVAANQPRFEPGKFEKAVMVEEGTTNKYSANHSQGLSPLNFNDSVVNVTSGQLDPFGGTNAVRIQASGGTSTLKAVYNAYAPASGVACSGQIWVRNRSITQLIVHSNQGGRQETVLQSDGWKKIIWENIIGDGYGILQHQLRVLSVDDEIDCDVAFLQYEEKPYCTSWQIGGTARAAETLTIPTEGVLNPQEGTVDIYLYVNPAHRDPTLVRQFFSHMPGPGNANRITMQHNNSAVWAFTICDASGNGHTVSISDSEVADGWRLFTMKWSSEEFAVFVDGIKMKSVANPTYLPSSVGDEIIIQGYTNALIDDLRISSRARTDEEILAAYQSGKPLSVDKYTTYKLDFNDKLNPTKDISSFQFSADGDLYLPEIIEELDMTEPTFTRNSVAYLSDGTQVAANVPRFEQGKFGKAVMVEEGTTNKIATEGGAAQDWSKWSHWGSHVYWQSETQYDDPVMGKVFQGTATDKTYMYDYYPYAFTSGVQYTLSVYLKADRAITKNLTFYLVSNVGGQHIIASEAISATITTEWQRFSAALTPNETTAAGEGGLGVDFGSGNEGVVYYAARPQLEQKPYPTSFIDGTREAETLTVSPASKVISDSGPWTIECWAKSNMDSSKWRMVFDAWSVFYIGISPADNTLTLSYRDESQVSVAGGTVQNINDWHYYVLTFDGTTCKVYLDGEKRIDTDVNFTYSLNNFALKIASWHAYPWNGLVDCFRISSRARTDEEILAAYQSNKPLPVDKDTTYKLGFDNSLNPNKNINTIQIDKNRILFIPEFEEGVSF